MADNRDAKFEDVPSRRVSSAVYVHYRPIASDVSSAEDVHAARIHPKRGERITTNFRLEFEERKKQNLIRETIRTADVLLGFRARGLGGAREER